jgi:hypothetical protein
MKKILIISILFIKLQAAQAPGGPKIDDYEIFYFHINQIHELIKMCKKIGCRRELIDIIDIHLALAHIQTLVNEGLSSKADDIQELKKITKSLSELIKL